jgi:hypothetical protein
MIVEGDKVTYIEASQDVTGANLGLLLLPSLQANQARDAWLHVSFNSVFTNNPTIQYHTQETPDALFNGCRVLFHEDKAMPGVRMRQN